jgi:hypothetical protein
LLARIIYLFASSLFKEGRTLASCPVCDLEVLREVFAGGGFQYCCIRCGDYEVTLAAKAMLSHTLKLGDPKRALLSHAVRLMQRDGEWPILTNGIFHKILDRQILPKPAEQANNLLLWLGNAVTYSDETVEIPCESLQAIIGSHRTEGVYYVAIHLQNNKLISFDRTDNSKATPPLTFHMTFEGWREFERLKQESIGSRTVFMAMKYGDSELNQMVDTVFRPAVKDTGFELLVLSDVPKAGLIDDRMRVEIRKSRFMIADVTHGNLGAYWEAGFAEGLGKPVIYTCKKDAFDAGASHFDTNHHLTVTWHAEHNLVARELKATIRATLPADAKLNDE